MCCFKIKMSAPKRLIDPKAWRPFYSDDVDKISKTVEIIENILDVRENTLRKKKRKEMWNISKKIEDRRHYILSGSPAPNIYTSFRNSAHSTVGIHST